VTVQSSRGARQFSGASGVHSKEARYMIFECRFIFHCSLLLWSFVAMGVADVIFRPSLLTS
jgi:hypothetical protein